MKTVSARLLCSLCVALALAACDGVDGASGSGQTLSTLKCPAGQRAWDFGKFPTGLTSESLSQLGGDLDAGRVINQLTIAGVRCGEDPQTDPELTSMLKPLCDYKTGCLRNDADRSFFSRQLNTRGFCRGGKVNIDYTCSDNPLTQVTSGLLDTQCVQRRAQGDVKCVPDNCYGRTRRDTQLQCAPDLIKPIESRSAMTVTFSRIEGQLVYSSRQYRSQFFDDGERLTDDYVGTLYADFPTRFQGTVDTTDAKAPRQKLTVWVSTKVPLSAAKNAPAVVDIFRCSIGQIDLSKYTAQTLASGAQRITFDETLMVPNTCGVTVFGDRKVFVQTLKTGLLVNGYTNDVTADAGETELYNLALSTRLRVSYDLEGSAITTTDKVGLESTCVPNPVDFFYNYDTKLHNAFDYFSQNPVATKFTLDGKDIGTPWWDVQPGRTYTAATEAHVRGMEFRVNKAGRASGSIPAELTVAMVGPSRSKLSNIINASSSTIEGQSVSSSAWLDLGKWEHADDDLPLTGLYPVGDTMVKDADGGVHIDPGDRIDLPPLAYRAYFDSPLVPTGTTGTFTVPIDATFRAALFGHAKYPLTVGKSQNYILQICTGRDIYREYVSPSSGKLNVERLSLWSDPDPLTNVQYWQLTPSSSRCTRTEVFSLFGENVVTPIDEPELYDGTMSELAPTTSGSSKMSATFDVDSERTCSGTHCVTTQDQSYAGSESPVNMTVFAVSSEEEEEDTTNKFATDFKILGFDVLKTAKTGDVGAVKTTFTIAPNYREIAKAFKKPFPAFIIEDRRITKGVNGLSLGFEYKVPLHFGPVQGDLVFGIGAGAGLGLEIVHEYNGKVESTCLETSAPTDGGEPATTECTGAYVAMPSLPLVKARDLCNFIGGTIAEPRDDTVLANMRTAIPAGTEIWVGAQVGNEYVYRTDCGQTWSQAVCAKGHNTYMRWLSDTQNFQKSESFGAFVTVGAPTSLGGNAVGAAALPTGAPVPSGVTLKNQLFSSRPLSSSYPSVCVRPAGTSGSSHKVAIAINVGLAAGVSVGFCTPSSELGVCIEGSLNLIEAKLSPTIDFTHTRLTNTAGKSATSSILGLSVPWSVSILSGSIEVKAVCPFGSIGYTLVEYEGFKQGEGKLREWKRTFQKDYQ